MELTNSGKSTIIKLKISGMAAHADSAAHAQNSRGNEENMIFKRKIYDSMLRWKQLSQGTSALMLEGARRTGKSTIVKFFAQNEYDDYMILDFAQERRDVKNNFEENIGDLDTFFRNLFLLKGKTLPEKKAVRLHTKRDC